VVANLSLHSKQLELGQDVLSYSNPDRIMTQQLFVQTSRELEMGTGPDLKALPCLKTWGYYPK